MADTKTKTKAKREAPKAATSAPSVGATPTVDPMTLKELFGKGWGWVKANPWTAAGTGALGVTNAAGLFDNDKLLGQGVGAALGLVAPMLIQKATGIPLSISNLGRANLAMGGGAIGSLFDTLRAKKEQEQYSPYGREEYVR